MENIHITKLNKFVLYVSCFAIALFMFVYSIGEVKAEVFDTTWEDVDFYYQLDSNCNATNEKGSDLTLRDAGGVYAMSWVTSIFNGGMNQLGAGSTNTSQTSACYGSLGSDLSTAEDDEFTYIINLHNPVQPTSDQSYPITFHDTVNDGVVHVGLNPNGSIGLVWLNTALNAVYGFSSPTGSIIFDENDRDYQVVLMGKWGSQTESDYSIYINDSSVSLSYNGGYSNFTPPGGFGDTNTSLVIGGVVDYAWGYNGNIGEVIVLNKKIAIDDISQLQTSSLADMLGGGGGLTGSVYWAGVGSQAPSSPDYWSVPVYYDFCDIYQDAEEVRLSLCLNTSPEGDCYDEGFPYKYLKQGIGAFECSGLTYLEGNIHSADNPSGQSLTPALTVTYYDESPQDVFKGGAFSYSLYSDVFDNYITANVSGSISLPLTGTSTPIGFVYDVSGYDWEDEYSEVCVYNIESQSIVSEQCVSLTSASGLSSISLPTPPLDFDQPLAFVYLEDETPVIRLMSNVFTVTWGEGRSIWPSLLNTGSTSTDAITSPIYSILNSFVSTVENIFPFSIAKLLRDSWDSEGVVPAFAFLDLIDENKNIVVSLPVSIFGSDKSFTLFGPGILGTNQAMIDFFDDLRNLSTYLLYGLFMFALWSLGKSVYNEINEKY